MSQSESNKLNVPWGKGFVKQNGDESSWLLRWNRVKEGFVADVSPTVTRMRICSMRVKKSEIEIFVERDLTSRLTRRSSEDSVRLLRRCANWCLVGVSNKGIRSTCKRL